MSTEKLTWKDLVPDTRRYEQFFSRPLLNREDDSIFRRIQPRLHYAFEQILSPYMTFSFMLLKSPEEAEYLSLIADEMRQMIPTTNTVYGGKYCIAGGKVTWQPSLAADEKFAVRGTVVTAEWVEAEQLFGCLRQFNNEVTLQPGLVHQANGGVLALSLHPLLVQPLLWMRLKSIVVHKYFNWIGWNESHPLPVFVPSMPIALKLVLVGDRKSLADFEEIEPEIKEKSVYSEFEDNIYIIDSGDMENWCQWVLFIAKRYALPMPGYDVWPLLIREAVRYSGDQNTLPLSPLWIARQLRETATISYKHGFNSPQFTEMLSQREWRENYLAKRMEDEILSEQILVETEGSRIGQINALSLIEIPGYPHTFGVPSRITCVVHIGDGEFTDIDRKAELSGNIHAKGVLIMQAFLMSKLQLKQKIPFSASLTFEQSYNEVDGDSASMAELSALISALAEVPINQSIAITGSVDQFGHAQPVSGLNEKIESFFYICQKRKLNGKQGVIIPSGNVRHLSLRQDVLDSVKAGQFTLWSVEDITDALPLLTNLTWDGEEEITLMQKVQERIVEALQENTRYRYSWALRWFRWLK